jgi:hypothetical protein
MEAWTTTVTTECTCENYNNEADTFEPSTECYGDCGEWAWEDATSLIASWAKHWDTNGIRVEATRMTWQNVSAYAEMTFHNDNEQALRLFTVNGDYRVELSTTEDGQLTVTRYSHDEPMGCSMVAYPVSVLD